MVWGLGWGFACWKPGTDGWLHGCACVAWLECGSAGSGGPGMSLCGIRQGTQGPDEITLSEAGVKAG